jgi:hypothetical protein
MRSERERDASEISLFRRARCAAEEGSMSAVDTIEIADGNERASHTCFLTLLRRRDAAP